MLTVELIHILGQTVSLGKLGLTLVKVISCLCASSSLQHEACFISGGCNLLGTETFFPKFVQISRCGFDLAWAFVTVTRIHSQRIGRFVNF